jgi:hypothetical protein
MIRHLRSASASLTVALASVLFHFESLAQGPALRALKHAANAANNTQISAKELAEMAARARKATPHGGTRGAIVGTAKSVRRAGLNEHKTERQADPAEDPITPSRLVGSVLMCTGVALSLVCVLRAIKSWRSRNR